jgi:hypothetical protein
LLEPNASSPLRFAPPCRSFAAGVVKIEVVVVVMKKLLLCSALCLGTSSTMMANLIVGWDFHELATSTITPYSLPATVGSGTIDLSAFSNVPTITLTNFAGSTINVFAGGDQTAGGALSLQGVAANGLAVKFAFSTQGYQNIDLSFATRGTSSGFDLHAWSWSLDDVQYTDFTSFAANKTSTWSTEDVNFSSVSALNNAPTVYLKLTLSGATAATGNNRLDNLQITGTDVPEPVGLLALGALMLLGGRKFLVPRA